MSKSDSKAFASTTNDRLPDLCSVVQKLLNAVDNWKTRILIYHAVQKYVNSRCSLLLIFLRFFQDRNISGCSVLLKIALWSNLSKATFVQGTERGPNVTSTRLMLHKVFEGCDHLWTRIHNCGCAASLSIRPTVCQTSEDGGDAEWYLPVARRELCNDDFIYCRWWTESAFMSLKTLPVTHPSSTSNKNACWEMSSGMNWNEHAGDDESDDALRFR